MTNYLSSLINRQVLINNSCCFLLCKSWQISFIPALVSLIWRRHETRRLCRALCISTILHFINDFGTILMIFVLAFNHLQARATILTAFFIFYHFDWHIVEWMDERIIILIVATTLLVFVIIFYTIVIFVTRLELLYLLLIYGVVTVCKMISCIRSRFLVWSRNRVLNHQFWFIIQQVRILILSSFNVLYLLTASSRCGTCLKSPIPFIQMKFGTICKRIVAFYHIFQIIFYQDWARIRRISTGLVIGNFWRLITVQLEVSKWLLVNMALILDWDLRILFLGCQIVELLILKLNGIEVCWLLTELTRTIPKHDVALAYATFCYRLQNHMFVDVVSYFILTVQEIDRY